MSGEPSSHPSRRCRHRMLLPCAQSDSFRLECRMQSCELTARVGSELHDARGWSGGATREQIQIHTTPLPLTSPFFRVRGSGSMWILRWRGDFSVATPSVLLAPCPFEGELSLNVHKRPTWNLAPINTAARSTGRHERPGLKKHKGSTSAMRSSMLRCLDSTPAITISPDPFVSLSIQHHVGSEDTSAEPLL